MDEVLSAKRATKDKNLAVSRLTPFFKVLASFLALLLASIVVALRLGPVHLHFSTIMHTLSTPYNPATASSTATIVWEVRFPRIVLAALVGMALAGSGVAFQSLLRNDLAEPYVLGISSGASVAAVMVGLMAIPVHLLPLLQPLAAFVGAGLVLLIVMSISYSYGRIDTRSLLLTGVIVSAFLWAVELAALRIAGNSYDEILNWLMGSLASATWQDSAILAIIVAISYTILIYLSPSMNLYSLGEESAKQLGLDAERFKWILIVTATTLAAATVSLVGIIGFIGLIAPHLARKLLNTPDHRQTVPIAAFCGAILLVWSDTLARVLLSGDILPVGIITAFLGAPFFCWKMVRR
jgi:iron complex transport system permease protein